tara:strand:+ start:815 stop:1003 length:189 start_codon:yes stop_codon:yes gene_type:complete
MANEESVNKDDFEFISEEEMDKLKKEHVVDAFVNDMVKQHPNYYSLGQAIHKYYLENIKNDD